MNVYIQVMGELFLKQGFKMFDQKIPDSRSTKSPEPLIRSKPTPRAIPLDNLGPLREPAMAIAQITQAPIEIGFQSLLAVASLAAQSIADVETLHGKTPTSLFLLTVAASGERKSTCDKLAMSAIQEWEGKETKIFRSNLKDYEFEREIFEGLKRKHIKEAGGEGGVADGQVPQPPIEPLDPRKILSDLTFEGLLHHFECGSPSVGIFSEEGGQIFGGHAMSKDNLLKTVAGLSRVWDAAPLNRTRAGQPLCTFRHRRGCLHLMLQDKVAESVFANETLKDQGFLSRCLIAVPESNIGTRLINEDDSTRRKKERAKGTLSEFSNRISHLLSMSKDLNGEAKELDLNELSLDRDARDVLVAFFNRLEVQQAKGRLLESISGFASKAAEQAARIAGVFALFADPDAQSVNRETMSDAVELADWFVNQAFCALDAGSVDPVMQEAEQLRHWLIKKHSNTPFVKRDVVKNGPSNIRDTRKVERLLTILEEYHWVERCSGVKQEQVRARKAWRLVCHD